MKNVYKYQLAQQDIQENEPQQIDILEKKIVDLETKYDFVRTEMLTNSRDIANLSIIQHNAQNKPRDHSSVNIDNQFSDKINQLEMEIYDIQKHLNSIEQYLRVNNIEIIGLPEPSEEENNEDDS